MLPLENINVENAVADVKSYLLDLQNQLCAFIKSEDEKADFLEDHWQHGEGGGGKSRILTSDRLIEKAGVNFSHVHGKALPNAATVKRPELANAKFQALGVSTVVHPLNPYVPTSHFNVRCIIVEPQDHAPIWWFGGGFDLTPFYGFEEDCVHWHQTAKAACDPFGTEVYSKYKEWADCYFFLPHRNEPRGIGGIFFDDLNEWGFARCLAFMKKVGEHYIKAYQPIVMRRKQQSFGQKERDFQLYRRGRYVEFNLLYDRGTLFGLQSSGRTESILMSLPPHVTWQYNWRPEEKSAEARLYHKFLQQRCWI